MFQNSFQNGNFFELYDPKRTDDYLLSCPIKVKESLQIKQYKRKQ